MSENYHGGTMKTKIFYFLISIFLISLTSVIAQAPIFIPHEFYGSVEVNGTPAPDNNVIFASVGGETYSTVTLNGRYGGRPAGILFFVRDPLGDNAGKTINFAIGGKAVGSYIFGNNGYTELNFSTTTFCGDGYCLGDETCSSCWQDCGVCTGPPTITIHSPIEGKVYNTTEIDLNVSADQEILVWMYTLSNATNSTGPVLFTPNTVLNVKGGDYELEVMAMNNAHEVGTNTVSFSVQLPACGNGVIDGDEECDTNNFGGKSCSTYGHNSGSLSCTAECKIDSSGCSTTGGDSGNGGGGGGGGCSYNWKCTDWSACSQNGEQTRTCTNEGTCKGTTGKPAETQDCVYIPPVEVEEEGGEGLEATALGTEETTEEETTEETEEQKTGLGAITGAFIGVDGKLSGLSIFILILLAIGGCTVIGRNYYTKNIKKK